MRVTFRVISINNPLLEIDMARVTRHARSVACTMTTMLMTLIRTRIADLFRERRIRVRRIRSLLIMRSFQWSRAERG